MPAPEIKKGFLNDILAQPTLFNKINSTWNILEIKL